MSMSRRDFLKTAAAASALSALGSAGVARAEDGDTRWVKSVCRYCGTGCGLYVGVQGDRVVAVQGDKDNHNAGFLCLKGFLLPQIMGAHDRHLHPLVRKGDRLERASWDEAMALVAARFREAIDRHGPDSVGFYGSGQGLTEESYVANKLFKAGIRTNNVDGNPRLCMAAPGGCVSTYSKDEPMSSTGTSITPTSSPRGTGTPGSPIFGASQRKGGPGVDVVARAHTSRIADLHLSFTHGTACILNAARVLAEGCRRGFMSVCFSEGTGQELADWAPPGTRPRAQWPPATPRTSSGTLVRGEDSGA
jgi:nitrate reductase NapA